MSVQGRRRTFPGVHHHRRQPTGLKGGHGFPQGVDTDMGQVGGFLLGLAQPAKVHRVDPAIDRVGLLTKPRLIQQTQLFGGVTCLDHRGLLATQRAVLPPDVPSSGTRIDRITPAKPSSQFLDADGINGMGLCGTDRKDAREYGHHEEITGPTIMRHRARKPSLHCGRQSCDHIAPDLW